MGKIYTRTGDSGKTALFSGKRVSKADLRVEALGTIDELNSAIGVVLSENQKSKIKNQNYNSKLKTELILIQNDLLSLGASLANLQGLALRSLKRRVGEFENFIDEMTESLPPLKNFILPGGEKTGAMLHLARAVCRRAERRIVELSEKRKAKSEKQIAGKSLIVYFNRLSDLLFTMSRFANFKEKKKEVIWPNKK